MTKLPNHYIRQQIKEQLLVRKEFIDACVACKFTGKSYYQKQKILRTFQTVLSSESVPVFFLLLLFYFCDQLNPDMLNKLWQLKMGLTKLVFESSTHKAKIGHVLTSSTLPR